MIRGNGNLWSGHWHVCTGAPGHRSDPDNNYYEINSKVTWHGGFFRNKQSCQIHFVLLKWLAERVLRCKTLAIRRRIIERTEDQIMHPWPLALLQWYEERARVTARLPADATKSTWEDFCSCLTHIALISAAAVVSLVLADFPVPAHARVKKLAFKWG